MNDLAKIGKTPLVELKVIEKHLGLKAKIFAKLECYNPGGSVKDRVALAMIEDAESKGLLNKHSVIIEPTSGNTGIGLSLIAKLKGYKIQIVMPDTMSIERREAIQSYGAELVLTDGKLGMKGAIAKANELAKENPNSFIPSQFTNPANPQAHYKTTGPEIYQDLKGNVDILVAGVGTGGTVSGAGKFLKEQNPNIKVVAVEPESSPVLTKGISGPHKIQGIGAGFVPETLDRSVLDEVIPVSNEEAFTYGKLVNNIEDVLVGISSGAALCAAVKLAKRKGNENKNIVVIFPDTGKRYYSTPLFEN